MRRGYRLLCLGLLLAILGGAREIPGVCGTYPGNVQEDLFRHRQNIRLRRETGGGLRPRSIGGAQAGVRAPAAGQDHGDLAVIYDSDGVVAGENEFSLGSRTVVFTPASPGAYRVSVKATDYDASAATQRQTLGDDDAVEIALPFRFPFFGSSYDRLYLNSDGNLTFGVSDTSSSERSLGRVIAGPPRVAGLFRDLDPSQAQSQNGVFVQQGGHRVVFTWVAVPEFREFGAGTGHNFQIRLFADGRIEFAYGTLGGGTPAVVGIAPGGPQGSTNIIHFDDTTSGEYSGAIAERFSSLERELDYVMIGQRFYENHDDAYDFLVIFNALDIQDSPGSLASERTVRNTGAGFGDLPIDVGRNYGSAARLQGVINMGPMFQYPNLTVRIRNTDNPLTILAHEAGHRFLAYVSYREPGNTHDRPMLNGANLAHWSFTFNSDASLLEGNRIREIGPGLFLTIAGTEYYSALDQYLMGLRPPEDVESAHDLFRVRNTNSVPSLPQTDVTIRGERRSIRLDEIIAAEGRRTPDHTVSQKRFRFAFILITEGRAATDAEQTLLADFRREFETFFNTASAGRAFAETGLKRLLSLSTYPAAGLVQGSTGSASVSIQRAAEADLVVSLRALNGYASVPESVTIRAGQTRATFEIAGVQAGRVDELVATPNNTDYATAYANIQVLESASALRLVLVSGGQQSATPNVPLAQPVVVRAVDVNNLPYPGVRVVASVTSGSLAAASVVTDETGAASFQWTPGMGALNRLSALIENVPGSTVSVSAAGLPVLNPAGIVNAASYQREIAPGSLVSIYGINLASTSLDAVLPWPTALGGTQVFLNGSPVAITAVRDLLINFLAPSNTPPGEATLMVRTALGDSNTVRIPIAQFAPGIFQDGPTRDGAIVKVGSTRWTSADPAAAGQYVSIYATGLGATRLIDGLYRTLEPVAVYLGGVRVPSAQYDFSGLVPGYEGLYVVNALVPAGIQTGTLPLFIEVGGRRSNEVRMVLR